MKDFYRTAAGRQFFEKDLPGLVTTLKNVSLQMEKSNLLEEKKWRLEEKAQRLQIREMNEKEK